MRILAAVLCMGFLANMARTDTSVLTSLQVFPPDINLQTNRGHQAFVVQATYADFEQCGLRQG